MLLPVVCQLGQGAEERPPAHSLRDWAGLTRNCSDLLAEELVCCVGGLAPGLGALQESRSTAEGRVRRLREQRHEGQVGGVWPCI